MKKILFENHGQLILSDTFLAMREIENDSIDMLLVDLPYGTTNCSWDTVLDFDSLWSEYNRICKHDAAMVFTAQQPFTTKLISSNIENFRYCWYWEKERLTNVAQVKKRAGKTVEEIVVFYKKQPTYIPQMQKHDGPIRKNKIKNGTLGNIIDTGQKKVKPYKDTGFRYPTQVLRFKRDILTSNLHPTQKPVKLFEFLIKTYTNIGDVVMDNTSGSSTTAIAAINTDRKFVCIDNNEEYFNLSEKRINNILKAGTKC